MKITKNIFIILLSFLIILLLLEAVLRITGSEPRVDNLGRQDDPIIYQNDKEIGWVQKPGTYLFKPWSEEGKITKFTVNKDGSRKIQGQSFGSKKILFFGGSLTQGWAVDDSENFVNYFQNLNNDIEVFNFGVGGYGGYQSLILQERKLKDLKSIQHVIYGFIDHHEVRNVAAGSWLYMLNEYSSRGHVMVPYGSIENGKLRKNLPIKYIKLPLSRYSSLIAKIEKRIMKLRSKKRESIQFEISKLIIQEMSNNASKYNSKFSVLILDSKEENLIKYRKFFRENKINFIYCPFPPNESVKGEGHPNEIGHMNVASCLNEKI